MKKGIATGTLKSFLDVHTWMGLIAGFGLFFAFYAGALTIFREPIRQWEQGPGGVPRPADMVVSQRLVDAGLKQFPEMAEEFYLSFDTDGTPTMGWRGKKSAIDGATERKLRLDPAGTRAVPYAPSSELADFVYHLHYTAGLPRPWGTYMMGVVCILYGLALVSGVILFLPTLARDLFALRVGPNLKRLWQDAHNVIGTLSLPFHAMFAWSGAVLGLGFLILAPFQALVFDQKLTRILASEFALVPPVEASHRPAPTQPVAALAATAQAHNRGLNITFMEFAHFNDAHARVEVYGLLESRQVLIPFGAVALQGADGAVLHIQEPGRMSAGGAFQRALIALHYGNYGGAPLRWVYFLLGLAGAFLFYSGNLLWIERRRKRRLPGAAQPRRTRVMAQATLGVCLGCIAGVSALFLATKLVPGGVVDRAEWTKGVYYAVFLGAVAWAFARPPSRGAVELLWLCAGLTAAIPLVGWGVDGFTPLGQGGVAILALHAVCLLMAAAFARFARAARRRAVHGDPHSVWAEPPAGASDAVVDPASPTALGQPPASDPRPA